MKSIKLTEEQKEQLSFTDVAELILKENGKKMTIADIFKTVIDEMDLPDSYFESKIGDFFGLLSTDKRFVALEKGFWDLKDNQKSKIVIDNDDEEDEEEVEETVEEIENDEDNIDEIDYDDENTVDDDDDEDDLKDLVIMDEGEESDMM